MTVVLAVVALVAVVEDSAEEIVEILLMAKEEVNMIFTRSNLYY